MKYKPGKRKIGCCLGAKRATMYMQLAAPITAAIHSSKRFTLIPGDDPAIFTSNVQNVQFILKVI
jgi:hypothetical protein